MIFNPSISNIIVFALIVLSFQSEALVNQTLELKQGQSEFKKIVNNEIHNYQINLTAGHYITGFAFQKSIDIAIDVYNPLGQSIGKFDQFRHNKEPFHFATKQNGIYQVKVKPMAKGEGYYSIGLSHFKEIAVTPDDKIKQMMSHYASDEPGGVIALVQGGKMLFSQNYGLANLEYDIPIDANTPFQMASASKPFTAFAIGMLAEQNKLSLDDDVRKHLTWMPEFEHVITIRHLLNHSSGLKDVWNLWEMSGGRNDGIVTQEQIVELLKNQRELNYKPGERFQYNNGGYVLLAEIVSTVTKQKFSLWMAENIFIPLGMDSTIVYDDYQQIMKQRAYSYESKYFGLKNLLVNKSLVGSVNVYSTVNDLSRWAGNLNTGKVGGKQLIKNMHQKSRLNDGTFKNYNFGVIVLKHNGLIKIQQGGTTAGFKSRINYYPQLDAAVIVMANTPDFNVRSIAHKTAEIFFAKEMQLDSDLPIQAQVPGAYSKKRPTIPTAEIFLKQQQLKSINDYPGTYYSEELNTTYKVVIDNKTLVLTYPRGTFPLNPKSLDRFGLNNDWFFDWELIFERGEDNQIQYIRLDHARAQNVRFKRIELN